MPMMVELIELCFRHTDTLSDITFIQGLIVGAYLSAGIKDEQALAFLGRCDDFINKRLDDMEKCL